LKVFYKDMQADLNNISMTKNVPFRQRTEFDYFIPLSPISTPKSNVFIAQNCISLFDSYFQIHPYQERKLYYPQVMDVNNYETYPVNG